MCLIIKENKVRIATKDIVVFKRFRQLSPSKLVSPYQEVTYQLGKTKTIKNFTGDHSRTIRRFSFTDKIPAGTSTVHKGLHSFKTMKEANDAVIGNRTVRCVIPKGTPYINGTENEIVSLALTPLKVVRNF